MLKFNLDVGNLDINNNGLVLLRYYEGQGHAGNRDVCVIALDELFGDAWPQKPCDVPGCDEDYTVPELDSLEDAINKAVSDCTNQWDVDPKTVFDAAIAEIKKYQLDYDLGMVSMLRSDLDAGQGERYTYNGETVSYECYRLNRWFNQNYNIGYGDTFMFAGNSGRRMMRIIVKDKWLQDALRETIQLYIEQYINYDQSMDYVIENFEDLAKLAAASDKRKNSFHTAGITVMLYEIKGFFEIEKTELFAGVRNGEIEALSLADDDTDPDERYIRGHAVDASLERLGFPWNWSADIDNCYASGILDETEPGEV